MKVIIVKTSSTLFCRLLVIVIMLIPILGCAGDDKSNAPAPTPRFDIVCRFTGTNLGGLGAQVDTYIKPLQQPEFHVATYSVPDNGRVEYPGLGSPPDKAEFTLLISFREVMPKGIVRPRTDSKLKAEVLVNGKLKATLILDNTTQFGSTDYLYAISKFIIE